MNKELWIFIGKKYFERFAFWVGVFIFCIILFVRINKHSSFCEIDGWWTEVIDPVLTLFGLLVPIFLWIFLLEKEWKDSLDKKLTVHFKLEDNYVMSCFEVYLSNPADIRNWGQQIGQQMNNGNLLSFFPYLEQRGPKMKVDKVDNKSYLVYELTIYLKSNEDGSYKSIALSNPNRSPEFNKDEYKIWFDIDSKILGNEELTIKPQKILITLDEVKEEYRKKNLS